MTWTIIIGILAGFLAGILMRGKGFGCLVNLIIGVVGSVLGAKIFKILNISVNENSRIGDLSMSLVGAIVLLAIVSIFRKIK
ncbi:GlsB/YeaQ/YmgE family stress response membrane protein [Apibacter muscae]|uniref:GlsB/YeaQ/YmgE family stress response membrane protein n=1 Tax=Apibacter muscae TaxID=2509004 RepID=A0A563D7Q9_9FLAO|nr:GlsB/YeaQ/YmgE family stress response membrane protein [Apibacter muscae]TWP22993.1 GlsB/YeaQ/YmgE family stress response membrane protein [Apibacter muscae]TWP26122.1 GlsB/YeaQ/YmgE family stress response membrane protein [Apibacter muscae]